MTAMQIEEPLKKREFETVLPMINIVFLLLIFFMLAGAFTKPDIFNVEVPKATIDTGADQKDFTVIMNAGNAFAIENTVYPKDKLLQVIREEINNNSIVSVQLKADQYVKSKDLLAFMEELGAVGLDSIKLLTIVNNNSDSSN